MITPASSGYGEIKGGRVLCSAQPRVSVQRLTDPTIIVVVMFIITTINIRARRDLRSSNSGFPYLGFHGSPFPKESVAGAQKGVL